MSLHQRISLFVSAEILIVITLKIFGDIFLYTAFLFGATAIVSMNNGVEKKYLSALLSSSTDKICWIFCED